MAKGVKIPFTISGLRQAREDLEKLNEQIEKTQDVKESQKLVKQYNQLSDAIDDTTKEMIELNKAGKLVGTRFDDLNEVLFQTQEEVLPLTSQIGEMEDRMYQLAAANEQGSEEFKALQQRVVESRKVIRETDKQIDLLAENQGLSVFAEGWSQVGASMMSLNFEQAAKDAGRLDSMVGNLGSIGKSSLMSLGKTVGLLSKTFIKFGITLLLNPIFLLIAVISGIVIGIGVFLHKMGLLKKAFDIMFAPIKLVIEAFKALTDSIGLTNFKEKELAEQRKKNHKANMKRLDEEIKAIDKRKAAQEKQADLEQRWIQNRIDGYNNDLKAAELRGEKTEEIEAKITASKIEALEQQKEDYIENQRLILERQEKHEAKLLSAYKNRTGETKKVGEALNRQREINSKLRRQLAEGDFAFFREINNKIGAVELETEAEEKARLEERRARYKEFQNNRLEAARHIQDLEIDLMKEGTDKDLAELNLKYDRLIEDTKKDEALRQEEKETIIKYYESLRAAEEGKRLQEDIDRQKAKADAQKKLIEDTKNEELALIEQYQEEAYQLLLSDREREEEAIREKYANQLELVRARGEDETAILEAQKKEEDAIKAKYDKMDLERKQAIEDAKIGFVLDGLSIVSSATELFGKKNEANAKKAFQVNKAAQMAQAIISTYQGANAIFASAAANPATVLFPAQPFIAAGIAISNGLINVAKIAQTKFEGGAPSAGGGGSAPSIGGGGASSTSSSTPSFDLFGQGNNLDEASSPESVEGTQQIQVQAVVSETEITNTQNNVANFKESAEL